MLLNKNKKKCIGTMIAIFLAFFVFFNVSSVLAEGVCGSLPDSSPACQAIKDARDSGHNAGLTPTNPDQAGDADISVVIGRLVGAVLQFVGIFFILLMIYAGYLWMFARGNEAEVKKAKDLIEAAVIGLVVVLSAFVITSYFGGQIISALGL